MASVANRRARRHENGIDQCRHVGDHTAIVYHDYLRVGWLNTWLTDEPVNNR